MIMRLAIRYIIACCWLFPALAARAQVLAKASLERDSILIGEPVKLSLYVRIPLGRQVTWFQLDTIPHFLIIGKSNTDTADDIDGKKMGQTLTITSFDSGHWIIPPLALKIDKTTYYTDSLPVTVAFAPDGGGDYHDIRDIEQVANPYAGYIPWIIAAGTLLALGAILYLLRRKRTPLEAKKPPAPALSPFEEAMESLKELRREGWPADGQAKPYYTRLNDILRIFVLRKMKLSTLEKTNEELILELRSLNMSRESFAQLSHALQMADFVKFAKYKPGAEDNERNFGIIESAIKTLNNIS